MPGVRSSGLQASEARFNQRPMKLSVIIPAFNAAQWIKDAVDSVLVQDFRDFELIVVDDGSTDETLAIIDRIAASDGRVSVIHQRNAGPGVARNAGLDHASGEYVAFVDSDDKLASPNALSSMMQRAVETGCDVLLARARRIGLKGELGNELDWCLRKNLIPARDVFSPEEVGVPLFFVAGPVPWGKLYRREFVNGEKLRFPPLPRSEDFPFVQTAMACAGKIAVYDDIVILHRVARVDSLESTKDATPLIFAEAESIFAKMLGERGLWEKFALAAKARAMLRLAYNLTAVQSFDGIRKVFAFAYEERKNLCIDDVAASFSDYALAKRNVDGILAHGSAEAWMYARMVAAEKNLRAKVVELRRYDRDYKELAALKTAQDASLVQSQREVSRLKQKVMSLEEKSLALERSEAYNVGMAVTWPARRAWGGVKCLRENGLKYTIKHAIGKVFHRGGRQ